jgi:hypothetical protein
MDRVALGHLTANYCNLLLTEKFSSRKLATLAWPQKIIRIQPYWAGLRRLHSMTLPERCKSRTATRIGAWLYLTLRRSNSNAAGAPIERL